jgi:hypothetical protein
VLVTSCDPLRAFIFNDGLVRLGTEQYQEPSESNIVRRKQKSIVGMRLKAQILTSSF